MKPSPEFVSGRGRGVLEIVAAGAGLVTTAGMIATPLASKGGPARRALSTMVVVGLAATTKANAARRWGVTRTGTAALGVAGITTTVERVGTRTGMPFGRYEYSGVLRPQVAGVPAIVPLAWFAMAVPAREVAHAVLGERSSALSRVLLGAGALTAWDVFLDPQMVGEGYWRWARHGIYRGIPMSNFAGWFVTGVAVMLILERALPVGTPVVTSGSDPDVTTGADRALVGEYAFMAAMETIGFARYFRDPLVAVVGGAAMVPLAALAVVRSLRR